MKYYLAPLEGVTNLYVRRLLDKYFTGIDKYYIPFLNPTSYSIKSKEIKEIDPQNNKVSPKVVPQIISKDSSNTIWLIKELERLGYDEVNLNFGCPSKTVTPKGKGAGMLRDLEYLDKYLNDVFSNTNIKISIKMRLGLHDTSNFFEVIKILNKYNVYELIIHPRIANDFYKGNLRLDMLDNLDKLTKIDIIYNGECNSHEDIEYIKNRFPYVKGIMMGRGFLYRPFIFNPDTSISTIRELVKGFYFSLEKENIEVFGWGTSKLFLKQILSYLIKSFDVDKKLLKKLFKANTEEELNSCALKIFNECNILDEEMGINKFI